MALGVHLQGQHTSFLRLNYYPAQPPPAQQQQGCSQGQQGQQEEQEQRRQRQHAEAELLGVNHHTGEPLAGLLPADYSRCASRRHPD